MPWKVEGVGDCCGGLKNRSDCAKIALLSRKRRCAGVAQLVEHQLPKLNVAGSSPVARF